MKRICMIAAGLVLASLAACNSAKATDASPGTVSGEKSACCASKAACTEANGTAPGAVSGEKADLHGETKSGCTTGAAAASPGAVSGTKSGCCKTKSGCSKSAGDAPTVN